MAFTGLGCDSFSCCFFLLAFRFVPFRVLLRGNGLLACLLACCCLLILCSVLHTYAREVIGQSALSSSYPPCPLVALLFLLPLLHRAMHRERQTERKRKRDRTQEPVAAQDLTRQSLAPSFAPRHPTRHPASCGWSAPLRDRIAVHSASLASRFRWYEHVRPE